MWWFVSGLSGPCSVPCVPLDGGDLVRSRDRLRWRDRQLSGEGRYVRTVLVREPIHLLCIRTARSVAERPPRHMAQPALDLALFR